MKVARGIPLTIGVERHESSNSAKAIRSKMVRGVAGLSNMVRGDPGSQRGCFPFPDRRRRNQMETQYVFQWPNGTRDARVEGLTPHWQHLNRKIETRFFKAK